MLSIALPLTVSASNRHHKGKRSSFFYDRNILKRSQSIPKDKPNVRIYDTKSRVNNNGVYSSSNQRIYQNYYPKCHYNVWIPK